MGKHILVVEDDIDILELVEFLLSEKGLTVHGVSSVKKFWEQIGRRLPDVIILDVLLPDGNGFELCMQLKSSEITKHIPIVLMSANLNPKELESNPCGEDFISKPFDVNDFFSKIQKQIA